MHKKLPKIIEKVGFDFDWSEEKVWELDLPVEKLPMEDLEWHFDIPFWNTKDGFYDLKPTEVLNRPNIHSDEYNRIMQTDLSYPIDIMKNKGRWLILDGLHRLAKAKALGLKTVRVRKVPREYINKIKV